MHSEYLLLALFVVVGLWMLTPSYINITFSWGEKKTYTLEYGKNLDDQGGKQS